MSCYNNCYLPQPPRAWSRVQNSCSLDPNTVYVDTSMLNKGNVLQYKANSSNLTKAQKYSKISKGEWVNRNTTWATQSTRGYTNPNTTSLKRSGGTNIAIDPITGGIIGPTSAPVTCIQPINPINNVIPETSQGGVSEPSIPPPVDPSEASNTFPEIVPVTPVEPIVIQDGGSLICSIQENVCTGEIVSSISQKQCNPTTDSDVPGPIQELCWNDGTPTWYPRQRYVMTNSGNKWPVNAPLFGSIQLFAPYINSVTIDGTVSWTSPTQCINITNFNIFQNGVLIKTVDGNVFTTNIPVQPNNTYNFYIIAENVSAKTMSKPSNSVTLVT